MKRMNVFEEMAFDAMEDLTREYNRLLTVMHGRPETVIFRVAVQNVQMAAEYQPKNTIDLAFVNSMNDTYTNNPAPNQMYLN